MTSSTVSSTITVPPAGTYTLDPAMSTIVAKTRAMFGLAGVKATFAFAGGTFVVADPITASSGTVSVKADSFDSGTPKRDHHVASEDYLHAEKNPTIDFAATSVAQVGGSWVIRGDLTVRGTSAPVELAVQTFETAGNTATLTATTTIDRYAHGLLKAKGMAAKNIDLTITAQATRS